MSKSQAQCFFWRTIGAEVTEYGQTLGSKGRSKYVRDDVCESFANLKYCLPRSLSCLLTGEVELQTEYGQTTLDLLDQVRSTSVSRAFGGPKSIICV